jgi:DNA polymerase I-like protein with 3'-5' exonuclease and polymerase domains
MTRRGVLIDQDKLAQIEEWTIREEHEQVAIVKHHTGVDIGFGNFMSAERVAPALEEIGANIGKTASGAPQIDRFLLGGIDSPVANAILRARKVNKIRTTFAESIKRYMVDGRIHGRYHQIAREDDAGDQKGVRYGRLSAVHPNLQQQPSPDRDPEIAGEWRKIFIPEPGSIWGVNDYSQQEPRWTTHFAAVLDLPKAREAARRYREDDSTDNHEMMTRLIHGDAKVDFWQANEPKTFKVYRGYSKNVYLGVCYGEGGAKLAHDLGLPTRWGHYSGWGRDKQVRFFETRMEAMASRMETGQGYFREAAGEEAQEIMDQFDREAPFIRGLANKASERASQRGHVITVMGRKLNFEMKDNGEYDYTHKALNRIIQGSSGDQTKLAICEIDDAGHYLQLQVHDETDGSYASVEEAKAVGTIMKDCIKQYCDPMVPFKVDTEVGPSWGEIKGV